MKRQAKRIAHALGFEVKRWRWSPGYLTRLAAPATVVDVGAGFGTIELHRAFPGARFCLFEPLREYAPQLERLARAYDCRIHYQAVGASPGVLQIHVDPRWPTRTSFAERTGMTRTGSRLESRQVEVVTLDQVRQAGPPMSGPLLLKIDTEGFELEVVRGATGFLQDTAVVIAEVSIAPRFAGGYTFAEFIAAMEQHGFAVHDVLRVSHVKGSTGARFADVVFRRRVPLG
ncbi:MAG: FkbM family methyltransferase [Candidatus Latescibacterota bacterium]